MQNKLHAEQFSRFPGQCLLISVGAGVRCMPVSSWHPCGSSWAQQGWNCYDFHHNHDVLVPAKRSGGELACLVGEHGFAYHVHLGVHIMHFLAMDVGGIA